MMQWENYIPISLRGYEMIKYYCEICQKHIDHSANGYKLTAITLSEYNHNIIISDDKTIHGIDLCSECMFKVKRITNERPTQKDYR